MDCKKFFRFLQNFSFWTKRVSEMDDSNIKWSKKEILGPKFRLEMYLCLTILHSYKYNVFKLWSFNLQAIRCQIWRFIFSHLFVLQLWNIKCVPRVHLHWLAAINLRRTEFRSGVVNRIPYAARKKCKRGKRNETKSVEQQNCPPPFFFVFSHIPLF